MPLFAYRCPCSPDVEIERIFLRGEIAVPVCSTCGQKMPRAPRAATGEVREIIDRPFQLKAIERPIDQQRAIHNRDSEIPIK